MKYIAHRGASHYAPENTLVSFALAESMGLASHELDVHLSKDGELVVHHDFELSRTALKPVKIAETNFSELRKYNVAAHFSRKYPPQNVPTLREVFEILGSRSKLNVEVKNEGGIYKGIEKKTLDCAGKHFKNWRARLSISSFDHETLERARKLSPEVRIGVLAGKVDMDEVISTALKLKAESVNISGLQASAALVKKIHAAGLKVLVYTINERKHAAALEKIGVDGVFTNRPDLGQENWANIGGSD